MSKYPIYALIEGSVTQVDSADDLATAGAIVAKLQNEGFECLAIGYSEEPVVEADDWDLGPACGLEPEVCESCQ